MKIVWITALLVSTVLVAPLMYLEARTAGSELPYPLFVVLWLVPAMFVFAAAPLVSAVRTGESVVGHPLTLFARITFLVLAALVWILLVHDQMPCFLGVPNCD